MIPGHKHLVFEQGLQSAWLYETRSPHVDELIVAGITQSRGRDIADPQQTAISCATNANHLVREGSNAAWEMRAGPSRSGCRARSQTTSSCSGQESGW